ncbi:serine/threonine-protein kinase [Spirillospora sp. NPDC029432]|uniref:serine/threonine-protein kinase n=1 Tax=Spirillospora sp. NPDC029432 TaxID=3154599 RepID=UPI003456A7A2
MRPLEPADPRTIGDRYRVLARIGSGGMGTVYFGRSPGGRAVAIKLVHAELAADAEFRERFRREAAAARTVGGGFTAAVLDADPDAAVPWLASEFLAAVPLDEAVRDGGALPPAAARTLAAGIAEALRAIHRAGIVHRDLKPANVLLTADGPRVIDFGIARALDAATITRPGDRAGSPGFMAPEQVAGAPAGPPADVFSFGSTLAYACTGAEPFGEGPWHAKMFRIESGAPRLGRIADEELRALVASCMDRDPARRPSAEELAEHLAAPPSPGWLPSQVTAEIRRRAAEAENPPPPRARRLRRPPPLPAAAAAAITLALGAGGAIIAWPSPGPDAAGAPPSAAPSQTVRTSRPSTRTLEFYVTGDVRLTSMTYTVNGRDTTLRNVRLPWRQVVQIPALPRQTKWRLRYKFPPGEVRWRVLVDGFGAASGMSSARGRPSIGDYDGTH